VRPRIPLTGSFKPEDPGWQLERIGNNAPRGMVIEGVTPDKIRLIGHPCKFYMKYVMKLVLAELYM
jgi:hypothetical protein